MEIKSRIPTDLYRSNFERIFRGNDINLSEDPSGKEETQAIHESPSEEEE